ncbi:hypothetical protein Pmar_PMAR027643 [Perkinsus marinus ATCC 50983]|uniref:Uncharacterized protein n=1 Tax=Perkinsus marinus (strain ATCC 50983 / TXsc) TaxID=423536 RepID=C5KCB4_PERM5|nr:hypothetical protein Pmar_PMAR027643 [Perkinsus marinus ATCC 50983]EER17927.1 hypothetical protein Pmar_PMAR027643 [Perkinsus marinus ATCC 50983]|eukprot:XP_002786131.1 hypothetical protein Pmar_PMAR027643 [Perkinsus marinus ATCC 50983]
MLMDCSSEARLTEAHNIAEHLEELVKLADKFLSDRSKDESLVEEPTYPTHARRDLESELYLLKTENDLLKQRCKKEGRVATLTEEMGELVRMQAATISRLEGELKNTREECRQLRQRVQGKSRIAKDSSVTHENTTPKKKGSSGSGVSSLIEKYSPPEGCTPSMMMLLIDISNSGSICLGLLVELTVTIDGIQNFHCTGLRLKSLSRWNSFVFVNLTSPSCCSRSWTVVETMFLRMGPLLGSNCLHRRGRRGSAQQDVGTQETIQRVHEEGSINTVSSASRPYDWTALPALSAKDYLYLCALIGGLGSITSLAIPFLLKDVMHLHPAETALLGAIASIPMLFKPAVAVASDYLPLMGYRRKPYLVLGSALHSISLIALAHLPAGTSFVPIALIVLAISSAGAVVVTVKDTLMLETSNRGEAGGADLISDMSILATGGALSV